MILQKLHLTGNALKLIAIISMLVDHIGWAFIPTESVEGSVSHTIGRLTAPIMFFLLTEGFVKTSNQRKYITRLGVFALISQTPYAWYYSQVFNEGQFSVFPLNIMFTLLIGLIMLALWERFPQWQFRLITVVGALTLASFCDWGISGPLFIFVFYVFRNLPRVKGAMYGVVGVLTVLAVLTPATTWFNITPWLVGLPLAALLVALYNGEKGKGGAFAKWGFYVFYPLHLAVITGFLVVVSSS